MQSANTLSSRMNSTCVLDIKCRRECGLGLCATPLLANRMPLRSGVFEEKTRLAANLVGIRHCAPVLFQEHNRKFT